MFGQGCVNNFDRDQSRLTNRGACVNVSGQFEILTGKRLLTNHELLWKDDRSDLSTHQCLTGIKCLLTNHGLYLKHCHFFGFAYCD